MSSEIPHAELCCEGEPDPAIFTKFLRWALDAPLPLPVLRHDKPIRRDSSGRIYAVYPDGSYRRLTCKRAWPGAMPTERGRQREARAFLRGQHYLAPPQGKARKEAA